MPQWKPEKIWQDQDCFIIGGGTSLRNFDWSVLEHENTIGCNNAFRLGPKVCNICIFCDKGFIFDSDEPRWGFYEELSKFPNPIVTNDDQLRNRKEPWLKYIPRKVRGLGIETLGYNANTGAAAINLALMLGASTIYLLGFDMFLDNNGKPNWHNHLIDKPGSDVYARMVSAFIHVRKDLKKFPNCRILNVTKKSSLNLFTKLDFDAFWQERNKYAKVITNNRLTVAAIS